eukprot:3874843-Lingulodinium_polyedra.AAC.1
MSTCGSPRPPWVVGVLRVFMIDAPGFGRSVCRGPPGFIVCGAGQFSRVVVFQSVLRARCRVQS